MVTTKNINVTEETKAKLDTLKIDNETYSNVIARIIKELEEAKELNDKLIKALGKWTLS